MLIDFIKKVVNISKKNSYWNLLIVIIPFISILIYNYIKTNSIEEGNYTIGIITNIYWPVITHKTVEYKYNVFGKEYDNSRVQDNAKLKSRYLVQFSLKDNRISNIYQNIPVPDSVNSAPPEGWKERPEWAKKEK